MNPRRAWQVLRKDLRLGPRSPILLWALVIPVVLTLLVRGVFGDLFSDQPRLGLVDEGTSSLVAVVLEREGIDVRVVADADTLRREVEDGGLDAGLLLPAGFDAAVRAGELPLLPLWLSGESLPADRAVLTATVLDLVRGLTDTAAPVDVEVVVFGEEQIPIDLRLLPLVVMYAVAIPGGMVPASSVVEEKERGTLQAVLVTPTRIGDVLVAKGLLGVVLGLLAGLVTLVLNDALSVAPVALVLALLVGAVMMAQVGLLLASWAPDTNTLFAAWKAGGVVLFLPAIFFIWPGLPMWPARWMPAYYFLHPTYAVGVEGAGLTDVAGELAIGAAICLALVPAVVAAGRWLERRLAAGVTGDGPKADAAAEDQDAEVAQPTGVG